MKICQHCHMRIGGKYNECPICLSHLEGEGSENIYPGAIKLKAQSILYKIQLFLVLSAVVVAIFLEFIYHVKPLRYWSLMSLLIAVLFEIFIARIIAKPLTPAGWVWRIAFYSIVVLAIWGYMEAFLPLVINMIAPVILATALLPNLILCVLDKKANALVYLLINMLFALAPGCVFLARDLEVSMYWGISMLASAIVLLYLIIFNSARAVSEVQKRLYM